MLRVNECKSAAGAKRYYTALTQSDYYLDGHENTGHWHGKLADRLGLSGAITHDDFNALCDGVNPATDESLLLRQKEHRRVGYDWTFSAPKSVTAAWELGGDERILTAFQDAVRETMAEAETEMKGRVRKRGRSEDRVTGEMLWGSFTHTTTRPLADGVPDPHLHQHCFAFNLTWDEKERTFKAGQFGDLKRDAPYFEAAFNARLAAKLETLGYATQRDGKSFRLLGLPESVDVKLSRRTQEIEAKARELGITDAASKAKLGERTRKHKDKTIDATKQELRENWWSRLDAGEREALLSVMDGKPGGHAGPSGREAMAWAVEHSFERASAVSEKRLMEAALRYGVGSASPEEIRELAAKEAITREVKGERISTTQAVLQEEADMLRSARDGRGKFAPLGSGVQGLEGEQRDAALKVLRSQDRVIGLRGGAGTGKTTMLRATVAAIEGGGKQVFAFAPTASASRGTLAKEGFRDADTVTRLLQDEKLQEQVRGQVLLIDEAGMLSSRAMRRVLKLAEKQDARVILSGDYRQHGAVERGDALRLLESESGVKFAELKQSRRQTDDRYRKAVERISEGSAKGVEAGFRILDKMGAVIEAKGQKRHDRLVGDYLQAVEDGKTALVIAPTHKEGDALTARIRAGLKERGKVAGEDRAFTGLDSLDWTEAQRRDAKLYASGQVVEFHQNVKGFARGERVTVEGSTGRGIGVVKANGAHAVLPLEAAGQFQVYRQRELGLAQGDAIRITKNGLLRSGEKRLRLNNGGVFTVEGFTGKGDVKLSNGWTLPKGYGHLDYAYTDTSHASQGKTVDRVFIAVGKESLRAANQQQWYVSVSRGREAARVYVADKDAVREAVQRSGQRMSATELVKGSPLAKLGFERKRVADYLKRRAREVMARVRGRREPDRGLAYGG